MKSARSAGSTGKGLVLCEFIVTDLGSINFRNKPV